jgi:hypothetical protein
VGTHSLSDREKNVGKKEGAPIKNIILNVDCTTIYEGRPAFPFFLGLLILL